MIKNLFCFLNYRPQKASVKTYVPLVHLHLKSTGKLTFYMCRRVRLSAKPEAGCCGRMPRTVCRQPVHNPQKPVKINIISMSRRLKRRAISQTRSCVLRADARTIRCLACPLSPKADENQYFISVAAGYLPSSKCGRSGGCPSCSPPG